MVNAVPPARPLPGQTQAKQSHEVLASPGTGLVPPLIDVRDVTFGAADGFPLQGTLFVNHAGTGPAVLVSGAIAMSRRHYARFAKAAAAAGAAAVLTYDYRGIGGSVAPNGWRKPVGLRDWASLDVPAAAARLAATVGRGSRLAAVGQSIGGIMFALSGVANRFARHATVASGHGWLGHTDEPVRLFCRLNLLARPAAALLGHLPPSLGVGMRLPRGIVSDWAHYTGRRSYLFDPRDVPEAEHLAELRIPTLALGFTDDKWTTRRALDAMVEQLPAAEVATRWFDPAEYGVSEIGHVGFFRASFAETLWPDVIRWLLSGSQSAYAS